MRFAALFQASLPLTAAGISLLLIGGGLLVLFRYLAFRRPAYRKAHITAQTTGTVVGPSHITSNDIPVPLVEYEVGGAKYKTAGPRFSASTVKTLTVGDLDLLGSKTNLTEEGELPTVVHMTTDSDATEEVLAARYPAGKQVPVFYDPDCPKRAYVERDAPFPQRLGVTLMIVSGIIALGGIAMIVFGILSE